MPIWLLPSIGGAVLGWGLGKSNAPAQPDPIASLTNLLIVGSMMFVGLKLVRKL